MPKIDTKVINSSVNLIFIIEQDLNSPIKRSGKWAFFGCPFHDDRDPSLGVTKDRYYCFGCGASGDAINWMMEFRKLSFLDACKALSQNGIVIDTNYQRPHLTEVNTVAKKDRPDDLQASWREIIDVCQGLLWSGSGAMARDYLHGRGLTDEVLKSPFFRVGYSEGQKIAGIWVDKGIVLPCFTVISDVSIDYVSYIKIRRGKSWIYKPDDTSKYRKLYGQGSNLFGLYGAEFVKGADIVFIVEGEFDSLLLHQEAGDLVGVCTLGGASSRFDWGHWGKYLSFAKWFFVAYDNDNAGDSGADAWQELSGRVKRVRIPEGKGKDITDAWKAGVKLDDWVLSVLADNKA